jgi:hypothetical protein
MGNAVLIQVQTWLNYTFGVSIPIVLLFYYLIVRSSRIAQRTCVRAPISLPALPYIPIRIPICAILMRSA